MYLTSITKLKLNKEQFNIVDTMSYRVKSLYNSCLYEVNKHFEEYKEYLNYNKSDVLMKGHKDNTIYSSLPATISQQTIKKLHKNYSSFFSLLKKKQIKEYDKRIKIPKYLKKDSRKEIVFTKSKTSKSFIFKDDYIYITVSNDLYKGRLKLCKIPPQLKELNFDDDIKYIEIVPKYNYYELHIKYKKNILTNSFDNTDWYSIDLGLNNICTVTSNKHKPFFVNGKHIKSINHMFNKKISKLKSEVKKSQNKYNSKKIDLLFSKRGSKLNNEIHKITDFIVRSAIENKINHVIIGYNKEWKQEINLGNQNNQNFVQIPFNRLINQLQYKLELNGIGIILQEESYTSKTSYFDNEPISKQSTYKGKRIKRGLFRTSSGQLINADVNGSLNIYRKFINSLKEVYDVYKNEPVDIGLVMNPVKIELKTSMSIENIYALIQSLQIKTKTV